MPRIFISYRRTDSAGHAGRLYDRLRAHFGKDRVFMDVTGIEAGTDFVDTIDAAVGGCDVLIAVIGREWVASSDGAGRRRLDLPNDFIRLEVGSALKRKVRVVPVLVEGALMPEQDQLPEALRPLTRRQAVELRDSRWDADVEDLIASLERSPEPAQATGSAPAPTGPAPGKASDQASDEDSAGKTVLPWIAGAGALLTLVLLGFWMGQRDARNTPAAPVSDPAAVTAPAREPAPVAESAAQAAADTAAVGDIPASQARTVPAKPTPRHTPDARLSPAPAPEPVTTHPPVLRPPATPLARTAHPPSPNPAPPAEPAKPAPAPKPAQAARKVAVVAWGNTTSRAFWNRLQARAYSERMAAYLADTLRERLPGGTEVHHAAAGEPAARITQAGGADQARSLCQETRASWVFAAHMEEPYASSSVESAFWPELRLAAVRCANPDPALAREILAPRTGEAFPFAHDLRATVLRFLREQGPTDR